MVAVAPDDVTIELYDRLESLPYFNPDLDRETDTPPPAVASLRARVGNADGLVICSPEYAHGVPGVLKNALDWLVSSVEFPGKPVALLDISPRSTYVQAALSEILTTMSATLVQDASFTPVARTGLDVAGILADEQLSSAFRSAVDVFTRRIRVER